MHPKDFFLAVLITAIWGVNFSLIKLGLISLDPFTLAGFRFLLCAIPLVFFIPKPDVALKYVATYGLMFGVGLWGIVSLGIYFGVSAGVASLVLQFSAFLTVFLGFVLLKEEITLFKKWGFALAFAGLLLIITITDGSVTYLGLAFILFGAFSWSIANIIVKKSGTRTLFSFVVWSSLFSPIPLFLLGIITQGQDAVTQSILQIDRNAVLSILFQVYPTTLFGYWVWNSLLKKYPASTVAPLSLLVPIFGLIGSVILFNEALGLTKISACLLIVSGLLVSVMGDRIFRYLAPSKNSSSL
jgi:O-acetylserine/cysteine efflux transporter